MRFSFDARCSQKIREDSRRTWLVAPGQEKAVHGFGDNKAGVARSLLGRAHARCCGHWSGGHRPGGLPGRTVQVGQPGYPFPK
jgi:hypothetical protein